jgi:DNA-binding transcriptional ArsR family regulator
LGVSKPTVTYHISNLKRGGFVELRKVELDKRGFERRYYTIKESVKLRAINYKAEENYQKIASSVISQLDIELTGKRLREPLSNYSNISFLLILHIVLYGSGVKLDEILRDCGRKVGKEVISKYIGSTFKEIPSDAR